MSTEPTSPGSIQLKSIKFNFSKKERLKSDKVIGELMKKSNSFLIYPFKVAWLPREDDGGEPVNVLINTSKKHHKTAVARNLLKRRTREAYRKNKHILYEQLEKQGIKISLAIVYIGKEIFSSQKIENKIILTLHRLFRKDE